MYRFRATLIAVVLIATACTTSVTPSASPSEPVSSASPTSAATVPATSIAPSPTAVPTAETPSMSPPAPSTPPASETPAPTPAPSATPAPTLTPAPSPGSGGLQVLKLGVRDASPVVPAADLKTLVHGNTAFALDLYRRLAQENTDNIVFGPYSISTAFGLLNPGVAGTTRSQVDDVLHFTMPTERLDPAFNELSLLLASRQNSRLTISNVNRLFGQQAYPFLDPYLSELTTQFGAPMMAVDYRSEPELGRILINQWVADQTNDAIKHLIAPGQITAATRFALVNAMYLNAKWDQKFNALFTSDQNFNLEDGSHVKVSMMEGEPTAPIAITPTYQAVDLPYKGDQLSMLIVMPSDMAGFESTLTANRLTKLVDSLESQWLGLELPKFSIRTKATLQDELQGMGINAAFCPTVSTGCPDAADFSGMVDPAALAAMHETLSVSAVIHQAWIKVAEAGTEAAAATAIIGGGDTAGAGPEFRITLDHPFMWFIRDRETGTILFMGRVMDPSQIDR
jgi:serpin B